MGRLFMYQCLNHEPLLGGRTAHHGTSPGLLPRILVNGIVPGDATPIGIYSYSSERQEKCWGRSYAPIARAIPGLAAKLVVTLSVPCAPGRNQPELLRRGQWRSDSAVVIGFQIELFDAQAVDDQERILNLDRIYDGLDQAAEPNVAPVALVLGFPARNYVETIRRTAEEQGPCPGPLPAMLDASVFPVELPEAADYPLHACAQATLVEALPVMRAVIGRSRRILRDYVAHSQLGGLPPVDEIPTYYADSATLAMVVGMEMMESGWPMLAVGCALALIGLQLEGDQHWVDAGIFRRI